MLRALKIVSDFDGVWTNQGTEASELMRWMAGVLARMRQLEVAVALADLRRFTDIMHRTPHAHGWAPDGRIAAYVDEDPLCETSALCRFLDRSTDPDAVAYRQAILAGGFDDLASFSELCFREGSAALRSQHPPAVVDDANSLLDALTDAGAQVVVVSNSSAEKIATWFRSAGVDAGEDPGCRLRVRGSAAKWLIGESEPTIEVGGRPIYVDRPRYRDVIEAEQPDLIIGDVFSLDLALPHVMRNSNEPGAPRRLVLRQHAHTPRWVLDGRAGGAIDDVVSDLRDLPEIVRSMRV